MSKPLMTLADVVKDLQSVGVKINTNSLSEGIASGHYPFGTVLRVGDTGRRSFLIFRTDYERWKNEFLLSTTPSSKTQTSCSHENLELISTHTFSQEDKDIVWEVIIRSWAKKSPH